MHFEYTIIEGDFVNAGAASSSVKKTLKQLNLSPTVIKRVVVALYEAEVNAIAHAYGGTIYVDIDSERILPIWSWQCKRVTLPHVPKYVIWVLVLVWDCPI